MQLGMGAELGFARCSKLETGEKTKEPKSHGHLGLIIIYKLLFRFPNYY